MNFPGYLIKKYAPAAKVEALAKRFPDVTRDEIIGELIAEEGDGLEAAIYLRELHIDRDHRLYYALRRAINEELDGPHDSDVIGRVRDFVDSAHTNADDTIHLERAAPVEDWALLFKGSLETALAFDLDPSRHLDAKVIAWFAARGIKG